MGKYGVNVEALEEVVTYLDQQNRAKKTAVFIDEIGKMESLSPTFCRWVEKVLAQAPIVVATIALRGNAWMNALKQRPEVELVELTPQNRDTLCHQIGKRIEIAVRWKGMEEKE